MSKETDFYAIFLNSLSGLIDDAQFSRWDENGIARLREAEELFRSDYRIRCQEEIEATARKAEMLEKQGLG